MQTNLAERYVVLVRPVPGETAWMRATRLPQPPQGTLRPAKRANVMDNDGGDVVACMVKSQTPILLHQVVDVVGVLSFEDDSFVTDPELASHVGRDVPRLYALTVQTTALHRNPPFVPDWQGARSTLLAMLAADLLQGDKLAAEFLLLSLVSSVVKRPVEDMAVGKITLALTQVASAAALVEGLEHVVASLVKLEVSPKALCARGLEPVKNAATNRLDAGALQLADGTAVVIDETTLAEGALDAVGLRNVKALQRLATAQTVAYDFGYFARQQPVDVNVIVAASGRASIVPCDVYVPLRPAQSQSGSTLAMMAPARLSECRAFLAKAREAYASVDLPADVAGEIENCFVQQRKADASKATEEALHLWISLARAVSATQGSPVITLQAFQRAMAMDFQRRLR